MANNYCEMLRSKLLDLHHLRPKETVDKVWVNMRCPFCGDSKKDYNKKRFYVKVQPDESQGEMPFFHCFNCGVAGPIYKGIDIIFGEGDFSLESETNLYYKKMALNPKAKKYRMMKKKKVNINPPLAKDFNLEKLHYINERLGITLNMKDITKYKIVIDLYQFLYDNGIKKLSRDKRIGDCIETDYVGFLTINNEFINMRNFRDSQKTNKYLKRYENWDVFGDRTDTLKRYYVISNTIDIMEDIEINIAEGPFDILGVYNHIKNKDDKNKLYVAVCGSGYLTVIKNLIADFGILFSDINIYSDNEDEKDLDFYRKLKRELGPRVNSITVYYNKLGKDFGVRKDQIEAHGIRI